MKIEFCLTNGLVSNYEYSNGNGHVANSIEHVDDVITVAVVWAAFNIVAASLAAR